MKSILTEKRKKNSKEDFDPRPAKYRGTAKDYLPQLLKDLDGENLCVSLLLDPCYKSTEYLQLQPTGTSLPDESNLKSTITAFKETLQTSPEQIHEIERNTTMQSQSAQWFAVRKYRITASLFGEVLQRRKETPPDNLVLKILQHRQFSSPAAC